MQTSFYSQVVATTALELGVDIGTLDVTLHLGYPGSTASLMQQAGRAGRGVSPSVALLITQDNPLEQHFVSQPSSIFGRAIEQVGIE